MATKTLSTGLLTPSPTQVSHKRKLTFTEEIAAKLSAGSLAGITGVSLCYPIDFAKTRLQKPLPGETYRGILDVLHTTRLNGGVSAWYNGLRPNLVGIIPEKGLKLAVFDVARDKLRNPDGSVPLSSDCISAVIAAFAQVFVTTPMEVVKINCQITGQSAKHVIYQAGLAGLYKGYVSTLSRDVTFNLAFFPAQSILKQYFSKPHASEAEKVFQSFVAGITAGTMAAILSTPFDVIKTRLQAGERGGITGVATNIIRHEGASSLFLGWWPRAAAIAPLFGIAICIYDLQKRFLRYLDFDIRD